MQHPDYPTDCPLCGRELVAIAHLHTTAPWQCFECKQGWFVAELQPEARAQFIKHMRCYDWGAAPLMLDALQAELAEAELRGTSLRMDQLAHTHPEYLQGIKEHSMLDQSWKNMVRAELIRRSA